MAQTQTNDAIRRKALAYVGILDPAVSPKVNRGRLLWFYRTTRGLSQKEIADRLGLARSAISRWERQGLSDLDDLISLSAILDLSLLDWLIPSAASH